MKRRPRRRRPSVASAAAGSATAEKEGASRGKHRIDSESECVLARLCDIGSMLELSVSIAGDLSSPGAGVTSGRNRLDADSAACDELALRRAATPSPKGPSSSILRKSNHVAMGADGSGDDGECEAKDEDENEDENIMADRRNNGYEATLLRGALMLDGLGFVPSQEVLGLGVHATTGASRRTSTRTSASSERLRRDWRWTGGATLEDVAGMVRPAGISFMLAVPTAIEMLQRAVDSPGAVDATGPFAPPMMVEHASLTTESTGTTAALSDADRILASRVFLKHARSGVRRAVRSGAMQRDTAETAAISAAAGAAPSPEALITRALLLGQPAAARRLALSSHSYQSIREVSLFDGISHTETIGSAGGFVAAWALVCLGDATGGLQICRAIDRHNANTNTNQSSGAANGAVQCYLRCLVETGRWQMALALGLRGTEIVQADATTDECVGLELSGLATQTQWQGAAADLAARTRLSGECAWIPFRLAQYVTEGQMGEAAVLWRVVLACYRRFAGRNGRISSGIAGWWVQCTAVLAATVGCAWPQGADDAAAACAALLHDDGEGQEDQAGAGSGAMEAADSLLISVCRVLAQSGRAVGAVGPDGDNSWLRHVGLAPSAIASSQLVLGDSDGIRVCSGNTTFVDGHGTSSARGLRASIARMSASARKAKTRQAAAMSGS